MFYGGGSRPAEAYADDIRRALGIDLPFDIITSGSWEMAGRIADTYGEDGVFLAGDAAHQLPPTRGAFGANTGIDDAWNLAWKLDLVLKGVSDPALLDTYSQERQPIGWLRHQQTFVRPDYARYVGNTLEGEPIYGDKAMELGQLHRSGIILGADNPLPPAAHPDDWAGQPGTRAPHLWLDGEKNRSTIDLVVHRFTLMSENPLWLRAAKAASATTGLALDLVPIGTEVNAANDISFASAFGTGTDGATLVRPDGLVCWRTASAPDGDAGAYLADVLCRVALLA